MEKTVLFYFYLCIIVPRLFYHWNHKPVAGLSRNLLILLIEVISLLPAMNHNSFPLLMAFLAIYHFVFLLIEKKAKFIYLKRFIEFIFIIAAGLITFVFVPGAGIFNSRTLSFTAKIAENLVFTEEFSELELSAFLIYSFGTAALVNELNNPIRHILELVRIEPLTKESQITDETELKRGKIIGVLERILFFFFVITGNYTSIAFILTAKSITRYKNLEDKNFAEYVLIGTLLSSSVSIFWAYFIKTIA